MLLNRPINLTMIATSPFYTNGMYTLTMPTSSSGSSPVQQHQQHQYIESRTNLIVNYLPQTMSDNEFRQIFEPLGPIESIKLIRDKNNGQSLCYGFVNYKSTSDAESAIKTLNGLKLQNKTIKVSHARPSSEQIKGANLYICGMPKHWTLNDMNAYFSQCGKIITSRVLVNSANGQSKGVGFIRFDQRCEADNAICKLNGSKPDGAQEPITVKFANPSARSHLAYAGSTLALGPTFPQYLQQVIDGPNQISSGHCLSGTLSSTSTAATCNTGWCIFVYNLAPDSDESTLWQLFGPFGAVKSVRIVRDRQNNKCKGFGFVTMLLYEDALTAIMSLNGATLANRVLQVSLKDQRLNKVQ
jgi:RNA recognition motif-containing protein